MLRVSFRQAFVGRQENTESKKRPFPGALTGATGLEPATSGVTGRRSNQLNYAPEPEHCIFLREVASAQVVQGRRDRHGGRGSKNAIPRFARGLSPPKSRHVRRRRTDFPAGL